MEPDQRPDDRAPEAQTDFGFVRIPRAEKAARVRAVFDSVARRYDVMNDLMSGGVHRLWKAELVRRLRPAPRTRLLDLACGTGDIATGWLRAGGGPVLATDINASMLGVGRDRAIARGLIDRVSWCVADAERLPLASASLDLASMAFGLRNCTDKAAVLAEVRRVLRPGGRFVVLEFSRLQIAALEPAYDRWSFDVLPRLGAAVAGDAESYRYLAESIRVFPDQRALEAMFAEAGFGRVGHVNLSGGVAAIHWGWRL